MNAPALEARTLDQVRPISLALLAMGGQGGGVLVDWIVALAEDNGYWAQSTSVPGVAQRSGATLYYIEMVANPPGNTRAPVLSLMPASGKVDIVMAAEWMEAGRAMLRGLLAADRTVFIASSHRSLSIQEKIAPGDGAADSGKVLEAARKAARQLIAFDMAQLAEENDSVISAVLFGALAGSGALPFARAAFEKTIRDAGVGVEPSLRAFAAGFDRASAGDAPGPVAAPAGPSKIFPALKPVGEAGYDALAMRAQKDFPASAHDFIAAGLQRVVDFQDVAYGGEYLDRLARMHALDAEPTHELTREFAKYLGIAMAYDDVIRVADLKTRAARFDRVRKDIGADADKIVYMTEYMHPRLQEIAGLLPPGLGAWLERRKPDGWLARAFTRGRRVETAHIGSFLQLYLLAGWRRRGTLRHKREIAHIDAWSNRIAELARSDYPLAVAATQARRLIKGYSDTHARGQSKFDKVMAATTTLAGRADSAIWLRRLIAAALKDENGATLDGALQTIDAMLREP